MKILFMGETNSVRSQLAEAMAKSIFTEQAHLESAGAHPSPVHPFAVQALKEVGADTGLLRSKHLDELSDDFLHDLDFVITFCPDDICPIKLVNAKKIHWSLPDPLSGGADENEQMERFRHTLQHIKTQLVEFGREYGVLKDGANVH